MIIKYDDYCKLKNHFKEGWLCFKEPYHFYWFKEKPTYIYSKGVWWSDSHSDVYWTTQYFHVDTTGIEPEESLRKVGEE